MSVLSRLVGLFGWKGFLGLAAGAFLASASAYPLGRYVEKVACAERIARRVAEHDLERMREFDAKIEAALAARRTADGDVRGIADGQLQDDGFRRD